MTIPDLPAQDFCLRTMNGIENQWRIQYWAGDYDFTYDTVNRWVHQRDRDLRIESNIVFDRVAEIVLDRFEIQDQVFRIGPELAGKHPCILSTFTE